MSIAKVFSGSEDIDNHLCALFTDHGGRIFESYMRTLYHRDPAFSHLKGASRDTINIDNLGVYPGKKGYRAESNPVLIQIRCSLPQLEGVQQYVVAGYSKRYFRTQDSRGRDQTVKCEREGIITAALSQVPGMPVTDSLYPVYGVQIDPRFLLTQLTKDLGRDNLGGLFRKMSKNELFILTKLWKHQLKYTRDQLIDDIAQESPGDFLHKEKTGEKAAYLIDYLTRIGVVTIGEEARPVTSKAIGEKLSIRKNSPFVGDRFKMTSAGLRETEDFEIKREKFFHAGIEALLSFQEKAEEAPVPKHLIPTQNKEYWEQVVAGKLGDLARLLGTQEFFNKERERLVPRVLTELIEPTLESSSFPYCRIMGDAHPGQMHVCGQEDIFGVQYTGPTIRMVDTYHFCEGNFLLDLGDFSGFCYALSGWPEDKIEKSMELVTEKALERKKLPLTPQNRAIAAKTFLNSDLFHAVCSIAGILVNHQYARQNDERMDDKRRMVSGYLPRIRRHLHNQVLSPYLQDALIHLIEYNPEVVNERLKETGQEVIPDEPL